jgi:hypothetical protein
MTGAPPTGSCWRGGAGVTEILDRAAERFGARDFISCTGLLFPRIEGVLRSNHASSGSPDKPSQGNLCTSAVRANAGRSGCLLLPRMFEGYLREVYFSAFDPKDTSIDRINPSQFVAIAGSPLGNYLDSRPEKEVNRLIGDFLCCQPSIPRTCCFPWCLPLAWYSCPE